MNLNWWVSGGREEGVRREEKASRGQGGPALTTSRVEGAQKAHKASIRGITLPA